MKDVDMAYVSNIQHFCVHDGNGFRTTVFLQGCPLKCAWCQNPELQSYVPQHLYSSSKCTSCGACKIACPYGNIDADKNGFRPCDDIFCEKCVADSENGYAPCEKVCYFGARSFSSHRMSAAHVFRECMKESLFYGSKSTGGGSYAQWR